MARTEPRADIDGPGQPGPGNGEPPRPGRRFGDRAFGRLVRNAGVLLAGNVTGSLLGLVSVTLAARALGPGPFGILVLIQTYVTIMRGLVKFQPYQPLIRYGSELVREWRAEELKGLVAFVFLLDAASGVVGSALALGALLWVAPWQGWDPEIVRLAAAYSVVPLFYLSGTPTGILRLFDRFGVTALHRSIVAAAKLAGVVAVTAVDGGLGAYLAVWMGAEILDGLLLVAFGWWALRSVGVRGVARGRVRGISRRHPGLWDFIWTTNLNSTIWTAAQELDVVIVGGMLGAAGAGLYKVAKQFGSVLLRLWDPLYQAIYPELARMWAAGDRGGFGRLITGSGTAAGCAAGALWLGFLLLGGVLLEWTVGSAYLEARPILTWYMLAMTIAVWSFPLQPAMLAMGRPRMSFWVRTTTTLLYLPALYAAVRALGLVGAGIAYTVYYAAWAVAMATIEWQILRSERAPAGTG